MSYVRVLVADTTFHGKEALTYSWSDKLLPGQLVRVPLKNKGTLGIVIETEESKPRFKVKPITAVLNLPPLPQPLQKLLAWMPIYYQAPVGAVASHFVPGNLKDDAEMQSKPIQQIPHKSMKLPELTQGQKEALAQMQSAGLHLLHGETGSGKTRVYIELTRKCFEQRKSAIILTPEIGLTSQLTQSFQNAFGEEKIVTLHSQITPVNRRKLWRKVLESPSPIVVIGARSALFAPLDQVGLIAIDESHENAYKQDSAPYYHATTVAAKLAALHRATLVLGSATPSIVDYFIAEAKERAIIYLGQSAKEKTEMSIEVVDRRNKQNFSKSQQLSNRLLDGIKKSLENNEQSLVFLNRRGTARVILCENCGWQATCPRCDLPLTYHGDRHVILCHSCNFRADVPTSCPECRSPSVLFKSAGTKAIVDQLQRHFPNAVIQRFDTDNAKAERLESSFEKIKAGEVDILVGTQTLAKGLDLPKLSFVGVVDAETSLSFPDFSAAERSYQLLSQVLGRIGRGHRAGEAVVQTYAPESPMLQAAIKKQWHLFYKTEIAERKLFNFPPFCFLLKIVCRRKTSSAAFGAAQKFCEQLNTSEPRTMVEGPAPCFHEKQGDYFQWQIVVKSKSRESLLRIIESLPSGMSYDIDPLNLL